jgi:hypothetical protein
MPYVTVNLHRPDSIEGRLISFFTRSPYSHTSLEVGRYRYQAQLGAGVTEDSVTEPDASIAERCDIEVTSQQEIALESFLIKQIGKPYDLKAVLQFLAVIRIVAGDSAHEVQEARKKRGRWFCSELIVAALDHIGVRLLERIEPWQVSPGLIALSPLLPPQTAE